VKIAYVGEAGCTGALPSRTSAVQPVFVHVAAVIDQAELRPLFRYFEHLLAVSGEVGLVVADSRTKPQNAVVAHSILTRKFAVAGDAYPHVAEMPVYGHSENHVGLQVADLLCSALVFPMTTASYCTGHVSSVHVQPGYAALRARYGGRLRALQYRYRDAGGFRGGLTVSDAIAGRPGRLLFEGRP
jgi:hypothetical protein